jgi:hypothetical protein
MKKLRFAWIDDKIEKVEAYRPPMERLSATIEVLPVKRDLLKQLETWTTSWKASPPDLIIIDQIFNLTLPLGLKGSSVAHLLRGTFPSIPMVCVTAKLDSPNAVRQEDLIEYTAVFPYGKLEQYIDDLFAIAHDFRKLNVRTPNVRRHLVSSLKAPTRDQKDLLQILPGEFQTQEHATNAHRMASWVYNTLLQRPGFLYDRLHAATLLGLTENGFSLVQPIFLKALYRGIFNVPSKPRWWVSELRRILFAVTPESGPDSPQLAGRTLAGIKKQHYSKCYVSRVTVPPPDVVVYVDATPDADLKVVRHEFATSHPRDLDVAPGFETRLVLAKKSK